MRAEDKHLDIKIQICTRKFVKFVQHFTNVEEAQMISSPGLWVADSKLQMCGERCNNLKSRTACLQCRSLSAWSAQLEMGNELWEAHVLDFTRASYYRLTSLH